MKTLILVALAAASCACGADALTAPPVTLGPTAAIVARRKATDSGCPILIHLGAKGYEGPHPGQWFSASYPGGVCAPHEWTTEWEVSPTPALFDICANSTSLADKRCGDKVGKYLWIGTKGSYLVTARYRDPLTQEVLGEAFKFVEVDDSGLTADFGDR